MLKKTFNANITQKTTFGIEAECSLLLEYDTVADLLEASQTFSLEKALNLGGGSNLLFLDGCYNGIILHSTNRDISFSAIDGQPDNVLATVGAGCSLSELCSAAAAEKLWGTENLAGIPGTVGGATVQNAGAYGAEIADVMVQVECFDPAACCPVVIERDKCRFSYRDSLFKQRIADGHPLIITAVTLKLSRNGAPNLSYAALAARFAGLLLPTEPEQVITEVTAMRNAKLPDPAQVGSAGSFFKNPVVSEEQYRQLTLRHGEEMPAHRTPEGNVKLSAAWLIDHAGCKPLRFGGASLWQKQPLVLVNEAGTATGADILKLENAVINRVKEHYGVELHPEVVHIAAQ